MNIVMFEADVINLRRPGRF